MVLLLFAGWPPNSLTQYNLARKKKQAPRPPGTAAGWRRTEFFTSSVGRRCCAAIELKAERQRLSQKYLTGFFHDPAFFTRPN
jgi:hypothetical protein